MSETGYRDAVRNEIIARAGALIEAEGIAAVQARRIAREAGCSVGTVYNLFGDIDGLVIAVNATTLAMLGAAIHDAAGDLSQLTLEKRLERLATAYADFALSHQRRWEAVFKHRLPDGREVPASYLDDQSRLLAIIETALSDVVFDDGTDHGLVARALFGAVHGIVALALDNRLGGRSRAELYAQTRFIASLSARGLERARPTPPFA